MKIHEMNYSTNLFLFDKTMALGRNSFLKLIAVSYLNWKSPLRRYNCEDSECYKDLARLRGVKYITWENKEKLTQQDEVSYFRIF